MNKRLKILFIPKISIKTKLLLENFKDGANKHLKNTNKTLYYFANFCEI